MTAVEDSEQLRSVDVAILEELRQRRLEYVALVANRRGIYLSYARDRFDVLERCGFVERTTDEVTYRITAKGEAYLEGVAEKAAGPAVHGRASVGE